MKKKYDKTLLEHYCTFKNVLSWLVPNDVYENCVKIDLLCVTHRDFSSSHFWSLFHHLLDDRSWWYLTFCRNREIRSDFVFWSRKVFLTNHVLIIRLLLDSLFEIFVTKWRRFSRILVRYQINLFRELSFTLNQRWFFLLTSAAILLISAVTYPIGRLSWITAEFPKHRPTRAREEWKY